MANISKGRHALVIGSSMAGLTTARVLANHFQQVTMIEKDQISDEPKPRKGVPQAHHLHGLLAQGRTTLEAYYPGITQELMDQGALSADMGHSMRWYHLGGYKKRFASGLRGLMMSRPLLEAQVRRRTLQLSNVTLRTGSMVRQLLTDASRRGVTGVRLASEQSHNQDEDVNADLVVDASGRGSASPRWLTALGYTEPRQQEIKIDLSYASRLYRREENPLQPPEIILVAPQPPDDKRAGVIFPIEGNRWIVTVSGMLGDRCPSDEAGFVDYTRSLCAPDIYDQISQCEALSPVILYRFPASRRRNYEQLRSFPEGYLVLGDAVCSFNPIFGQGMTSAILQAQILDHCLTKSKTIEGLWKPYFQAIAKVVDIPWQAALGEDFRYPGVQGQRPVGLAILNWYSEAVHRATQRDTVVYQAFLEVMNLMRPPQYLVGPNLLWRVIKDVMQHQ
jgi:2-polyprenyl-6-methoxyphenol hydroxylase-like FAD-dependent oxidoreductase